MEYPVKSFRQFVTEDDTTSGVIGGAGGTPASNAAMADDITAFSSRGRSMAGDIAAQMSANALRRQRGASWHQIEQARRRNIENPQTVSMANRLGHLEAFYSATGRDPDQSNRQFHDRFNLYAKQYGVDGDAVRSAFRQQRTALGLRPDRGGEKG